MATTSPQPGKPGNPTVQAQAPRPAGFFSRLEAFIVDLVILSLIQLLGSLFIPMILRFFRLSGLASNLQTLWDNSTFSIIGGSLLMVLVVIGYFTFFWTLVGFTPGKALLGLKVVRKDGAKVSFGRSLLRFFVLDIGDTALPGLFLGIMGFQPPGLAR